MQLVINKCPTHGYWAITVEDSEASCGTRVTPEKCCGRWDTLKSFSLSKREWEELANLALEAAEA